ncbi:MAG: histidinol-phosphatase [Ignavibacteria bacterium]|nr:histidinol-phosphatase [Ignavibacteria bacterium]
MSSIENYKTFAKALALKSGEVIKNYFRKKIVVESKYDLSPVTIADKKAEEIMREMIMREFPTHGIIGEEFGEYNHIAEFQWVLDPIDGTKSFICGAVNFGTLIALTQNGFPILGVINLPILNELLIGDNNSTELNSEVVKVRNCESLSDAILLTIDHLNIAKYQNMHRFENLLRKVKLYRNFGDCYGYYLLVTGFADIVIDPIMSIWDTMALIPIVRGADGVITDYNGNDVIKGNSVIASNKFLHQEVLNILNSK